MPSSRDEKREIRKQIGCMNRIFQIINRHNFLTGRRSSNHKLLQGCQQQQLDQPHAKETVIVKDAEVSTESSFSSSSCSSTFSSIDTNTTSQVESLSWRLINVKEPTKGPHFRDVVKESMNREAHERRNVLKHIDSPRPPLLSKIAPARFSYDGRESGEVMKHKEVPRFSLDSRTGAMEHVQLSSVVAKLMGLDALPKQAEEIKSRKTPTSNRSSSVYGEIERRITELEFNKSGKDLRALKQILEAMQKTREPPELTSQMVKKPAKVMDKAKLLAPSRVSTTEMQQMKSANCTTSPRLQRQSRSTALSSDSSRAKKQCGKTNTEKGSQIRRIKVRSDAASVKSERKNTRISQRETEVIRTPRSINTAAQQNQNSTTRRKQMAAAESATNMDQPSPISVLDDAFFSEDSPSPVKKISTVFQDKIPSPDLDEWHFETPNHSTEYTRSSDCLEYNHKFSNTKNSVRELTLLNNKKGTSPQGLQNEVYSEMGRVCSIPDRSVDEDYEIIRLLTADMMHQTEEWLSFSGEVPALVLDIERLIFKDLINEVITGEVTDLPGFTKSHRRKLFNS